MPTKTKSSKKRSFSFLIMGLFLFLQIPFLVKAADSLDMVINEIAWMGTQEFTNNEWIVSTIQPIVLAYL